jgi:signal transduction histidine kinase
VQALANLLDNALRVTPEGGCVAIAAADAGDRIAITVSDTGPGIEPAVHDHLFERFAATKPARGGGAGLGLAIVRGIAEAHGGAVSVRTEVGAGATFEIDLPRG